MFQVFFYSQGIFEDAKVPGELIPFAIIGTNAVNVLMTFVAVSWLSKDCPLPCYVLVKTIQLHIPFILVTLMHRSVQFMFICSSK